MSSPLVTVVIPVYNGAAFVADAIESVLVQKGVQLELVVVDDGSTDETPRILADFGDRISVRHQTHHGAPAARNDGIRSSRGEFLAFLDADDLHPDGYLQRFIDSAARVPGAEIFHCGWRGVDLEGHPLYANDALLSLDADPFHQMLLTGSPPINALFLRRSVLSLVGMFDESLPHQQDWDFWLRVAASGAQFQSVPDNVAIVRRRSSSISRDAGSALALTGLAVLERRLARHSTSCSACTAARGLALWKHAALRSSAWAMTRRFGLTGRLGWWIGVALAVARTPRLLSAALDEFHTRQVT
ncbi:MAG TPA: glycosyltransferase [Gemmatimonadaceae bacterium]|nr:glycosyltransferase [Gemmatimonadaceae bacterium]